MKRRIQLLFTILGIGTMLSAQITISSANFPAPGDTLRTAFDGMPSGIDLLEQGGDQAWDFTTLAGIGQETVIREASDGNNFVQFPAADVLLGDPDGITGELYYNSTSEVYELLGYVGPDPAGFGIDLIAKIEPPSADRRAPMNYFDVSSTDNDISVAFSADLIPGGLLDSFPFAPDSVRIRIATERLDIVDAWGSLSIPEGTYEVLREKRLEERETRLDIYLTFPIPGWQDVTNFAGFDFLGKDTTLTYHYFSNEAKEPIAVVTVDPITDDPVAVRYKSNTVGNPTSPVSYFDKGKADIFAYPNPAINDVRFDFINLPTDTYDLKIYNILGMDVFSQKYSITGNRTIKMDLSRMRKGTYLYSLVDSRGKPVTTKRLVILKP